MRCHKAERTNKASILTSLFWCNAGCGSSSWDSPRFHRGGGVASILNGRGDEQTLVRSIVGMLTCADTVIWAQREVFFYEYDHFGTGKGVPVLRS